MADTMMPEVGSKRSSGYDEYAETDGPKRHKTGRVELRLLLVGRYCGAVIGKGGETVKRIREKHRVQIRGLNNHAEHRVLSVTGDRGNCANALMEILPATSSEAPFAATGPKDRCNFEINLLVHSGHVGAVIGKGGSKIKEITEISNGVIKIYQECLPNSDERVVAIGGDTVDRIIAAMDIVLDTLEKLPPKAQTQFYDPTAEGSAITTTNRSEEGGHRERRSDNQRGGGEHPGPNRYGRGAQAFGLTGPSNLLGQLGGGGAQGGGGGAGGYGNQPASLMSQNLGNQLAGQLGNSLGTQLGQLGNQLQNQLQSQLGAQQGNLLQLQNQLGAQLQSQLGTQLQNQLGGQLGNQYGGQLQNQLQNQLGNHLQNQLSGQLSNQFGNQMQGQVGGNVPPPRQGNQYDKRDNFHRNGNDADMLDFTKMQTVTKVTVSPEICGAVIGKGGSNIKEIRHASGAKVDFAGNEKGSKEDRVITITGTQKQIQIAEQMMTQFVRERNNMN